MDYKKAVLGTYKRQMEKDFKNVNHSLLEINQGISIRYNLDPPLIVDTIISQEDLVIKSSMQVPEISDLVVNSNALKTEIERCYKVLQSNRSHEQFTDEYLKLYNQLFKDLRCNVTPNKDNIIASLRYEKLIKRIEKAYPEINRLGSDKYVKATLGLRRTEPNLEDIFYYSQIGDMVKRAGFMLIALARQEFLKNKT
jgi:hypothetical protein